MVLIYLKNTLTNPSLLTRYKYCCSFVSKFFASSSNDIDPFETVIVPVTSSARPVSKGRIDIIPWLL